MSTVPSGLSELEVQSLVTSMAEQYLAALGEARYVAIDETQLDMRGRTLAQSFLRNGSGATLDIAIGPNPIVGVLDMLVLASLQSWAFEKHWMPAGIGEAGAPALARLKRAEQELWEASGRLMSPAQQETLRAIIDSWIQDHPETMVVSLVRFDEFLKARRQGLGRGDPGGLLREVSRAAAAVDDIRLLGERALWFAGQYPHLIGQEMELTTYRLLEQPDVQAATGAGESISELGESIDQLVTVARTDLPELIDDIFQRFQTERSALLSEIATAVNNTSDTTISNIVDQVEDQRQKTIDELVSHFSAERQAALDDLANRAGELQPLMSDLHGTISAADSLAVNLNRTVTATDAMLSRFGGAQGDGPPISLADAREMTANLALATDNLAGGLEATNTLLASGDVERTTAALMAAADHLTLRIFWMALGVVVVVLAGLGALRFVPQRTRVVAAGS